MKNQGRGRAREIPCKQKKTLLFVRMVKCWNKLPSPERLWNLDPCSYSKPSPWTQPWVTCSEWPCMRRRLEKMVSRVLFHVQLPCDSVTSLMHLPNFHQSASLRLPVQILSLKTVFAFWPETGWLLLDAFKGPWFWIFLHMILLLMLKTQDSDRFNTLNFCHQSFNWNFQLICAKAAADFLNKTLLFYWRPL